MRNIIITGGELFNKGAQAMTFVAVDELKKRYPQHEIYLLSEMDNRRTNMDKEKYSFKFLGWYPIKFAKAQRNIILRMYNSLVHNKEYKYLVDIYRNTDLMIDISGYAFSDNFGPNHLKEYADHLEFAEAFNIPVYIMPQSFGPFDFKTEEARRQEERLKRLILTPKMVCAREEEGYKSLVSKYGVKNICIASDIVINNKSLELNNIYSRNYQLDIPVIQNSSVAIIPNTRLEKYAGEKTILGIYKCIVNRLLKFKKKIYIIAHSADDKKLCEKIGKMDDGQKVVYLDRDFSCIEFNEIVKNMDYIIASRFHSIVHAFKNNIPCLSLGWATKYQKLSEAFKQERYCLDIRENLNEQEILEHLDNLENNYLKEKKIISENIKILQEKNVFDILPEKL